jgi:uncharacterized phiE125 gp8 family phage protein
MTARAWTRYTLVTAATVEPVTAATLRDQIRSVSDEEDGLLGVYLSAARTTIENRLGRKLINQVFDVYFDRFADTLLLPFGPLASTGITSVKYQDSNNTQQTAAATYYESAEWCRRPIVRLKYNQVWPSTLGHADDVVIRATFGYGATAASVPSPIRHAIALLAAHMNENREPVNVGNIVNTVPLGIESLLADYGLEMPNECYEV